MNVLGKTVIVTKLAIASRPVNRPVLSEKKMRRLMMLSERLKPVRELWRSQMSEPAMQTSETMPRMLTVRESWKSSVRRANVPSIRL